MKKKVLSILALVLLLVFTSTRFTRVFAEENSEIVEGVQTQENEQNLEENPPGIEEASNEDNEDSDEIAQSGLLLLSQLPEISQENEGQPVMMLLGASNNEGTETPTQEENEEETEKASGNDIQSQINESLTGSDLTTPITIVLENGKTYSGDVEINRFNNQAIEDISNDFYIEIKASDAEDKNITDETDIKKYLNADGTTILNGNLSITGFKVIFKGINITGVVTLKPEMNTTTGNVLVPTFEYYGTQDVDSVIVVTACPTDVKIYSGDGDDFIAVTELNSSSGVSSKTIYINSGNGNDVVVTDVKTAKTNIVTGDGNDIVNVSSDASAPSTKISTGDGDDTINATISGGSITIDAGDGADNINLEVKHNAGDATINLGDGDDEFHLFNNEYAASTVTSHIANINGDEGNDIIYVDVSAATVYNTINVVSSSTYEDRLDLSGALNSNGNPITQTTNGFILDTKYGNQLNLNLTEVKYITDTLINKVKYSIDSREINNGVLNLAGESFIDYYLYDVSNDLTVNFTNTNRLLSNLVIDANLLGVKDLTLNKNLTVNGSNLVIRGTNVDIVSTVIADNITILVMDTPYNAIETGEITTSGISAIVSGNIPTSFVDVKDNASITVEENAKLLSRGNIDLEAKSLQYGGLFTCLPSFNVASVKLGSATITINGTVIAGWYENDEVNVRRYGDVNARAIVKTIIGYDEKGSNEDLSLQLEISVDVVTAASEINVGSTGLVKAARHIRLTADNTIKVLASSAAGSICASSPFAVSVEVITSDAHITIDGTMNAVGTIFLNASGNITGTARANRNVAASSMSGGYVAVSVVIQNVDININGNIKAGQNLKANANATSTVTTNAVAAVPDLQYTTATKQGIAKLFQSIFTPIGQRIKALYNKIPAVARKHLEEAISKINTSDYRAELTDDSNGDCGYAKIKTTLDETGKRIVSVKVEPKENYTIDTITYRYLKPGDDQYTIVDITATDTDNDGVFSFDAPSSSVVVSVVYKAGQTYIIVDPDDDFEEDGQISIDDLINSSTSSANQNTNPDEDAAEEEDIVNINFARTDSDFGIFKQTGLVSGATKVLGSVVAYECNFEGKSIVNYQAGKKIELIVNPNTEIGMYLKEGTLVASYKDSEGKSHLQAINAEGGHYYFVMPKDVDGNVKITAVFTNEGSADDSDSSVQVTGSIAVAVVTNRAKVNVSKNSVIGAESTMLISMNKTNVDTVADGSNVTKEAVDQSIAAYSVIKPIKEKTVTELAILLSMDLDL